MIAGGSTVPLTPALPAPPALSVDKLHSVLGSPEPAPKPEWSRPEDEPEPARGRPDDEPETKRTRKDQ